MGAGADEDDVRLPRVVPNQQEVRLNMALPVSCVATAQLMHPKLSLERFLRDESRRDSVKFLDVASSLLRPLSILLVLPGK